MAIVTRVYKIKKYLPQRVALRDVEKMERRKLGRLMDYRGFTYSPRTGRATLT